MSRVLRKGERSYWPTEMEMSALVWALKSIQEVVENKPLIIYTDHQSLTWLFNATENKTKLNQRLLLWAMYIHQWKNNTTIIHRPGRTHLNADILSRYPVASSTPQDLLKSVDLSNDTPKHTRQLVSRITCVEMNDAFRNALIVGYKKDPHWNSLYQKLSMFRQVDDDTVYHSYKLDSNGLLYYNDTSDSSRWKLCVPSDCHKSIFELVHDHQGHSGFSQAYERLRDSYHMPRMSKRLKSYIRSCPVCATVKSKDRHTGLLSPLPIPDKPCDVITMDFVTGLPIDNDYDTILTITDKFSKYVTLIAGKTTDNSQTVAERWLEKYYPRFGIPTAIVSDRDVRFVSSFWKEVFRSLNCKLLMSTAYSPQTDGQSERSNATMEIMLRSLIGYDTMNSSWVAKLPIIEFAINSQTSEASGMSPFRVMYRFQPRDTSNLLAAKELEPFIQELDVIRQETANALAYSRTMMAAQYDKTHHPHDIKVSDLVYIENRPNFKIPGLNSNKLSPKRFGPFEVLEQIGTNAFRLKLPATYRLHDVFSQRHLTKAIPDTWGRKEVRPPPTLVDHESQTGEFEVESILDHKTTKRGDTSYLIKWVGYPAHEATWISERESESFSDVLQEYLKKISIRPPRSRKQRRS